MSDVILHSRSGPDKKLHLEVPVDQPNMDFEVVVRVQPKLPARVLPGDYFELIGSVDDETLSIHPQPPLPSATDVE
jgi:hypothetical protein